MNYNYEYAFHPVGQGLFSSGCIRDDVADKCLFRWVYDCGTVSSQSLVAAQINRLDAMCGPRKRLDLVSISHFDNDHISGICELISRFPIGTLILPYIPLWQRMIVSFELQTTPKDSLSAFFINPTAYLVTRPGANIERILYVMPGAGEEPGEAVGGPPIVPDGDSPRLEVRFEQAKPESGDEYFLLQSPNTRTKVEFLKVGDSIRVGSLWEFVPYNDDPEDAIPESFRKQVDKERAQLVDANSPRAKRTNALRRLKKHYDNQFGGDSVSRNEISLFLYGGPIYESWKTVLLGYGSHLFPLGVPRLLNTLARPVRYPRKSDRCSILYTGDGYLDTSIKLDRMVRFFTRSRIDHVGVFQVMHHGADGNWHKGVASRIAPALSVFSSDPDHKKLGHPHSTVLRDFWPYHPVQVDKLNEFMCVGNLTT